jgi:predicted transcriptional regulator of viral defense system
MASSRKLVAQTDSFLTSRAIPQSLAGLLADVELDQPKTVSLQDIENRARARGLTASTRTLARRLQEHGWLLPLRTKGMYEFAPAARAGRLSSGDPFIELRATLRRRPALPITIAEDSAAWLHGLSTRAPERHVICAPPHLIAPVALNGFRIVRLSPKLQPTTIDNLPVWRKETLLVMMAGRPANYGDWVNVLDWLAEAIDSADQSMIDRELSDQPSTTAIRLAYLLDRAGRAERAEMTLNSASSRQVGPVYLGIDRRSGRYDAKFGVVDSLLPPRAQ